MKAKEWYTKMKEAKTTDDFEATLENCLRSLSEDVDRLIKIRRAKSDKAVAACIDEVNNKWIAICNLHSSESFNEESPMNGSVFMKDGFKAVYVELHPNRRWYFDLKQHKNTIDNASISMHIGELRNPVLILYGLTPYTKIKDLTINDLRKEFLCAAYQLGTIGSGSKDPFADKTIGTYARIIATHMTLVKFWIAAGVIDMDDIDLAYTNIRSLDDKYGKVLT